ncbi:MAG: DMT family transporter [Anaerolineales bacterium]|nr:DMT family transporter [Anaerolineales bacterium]
MKSNPILRRFDSRSLATAAGLLAVLLFGASFVAIKIALVQLDPLTLIPVRFALGLVVLWPLLARRDLIVRFTGRELLRTALLGGLGILLNQWFQAAAMVTAGAATASWLAALAPAFMAVLAWMFLREKIVAWQWLGIALALIGALLVSDADPAATFGKEGWAVPALLVASAFAWAVFSVFGKAEATRTSPLRATVLAMTWALFFSAILNLSSGVSWDLRTWLPQTWWALIFLGVACTGLAYSLYFYALAGAQSALIAALQYLEPLITILLALLLLQEPLRPIGILGGLLIIAGIVLVERTGIGQVEPLPR